MLRHHQAKIPLTVSFRSFSVIFVCSFEVVPLFNKRSLKINCVPKTTHGLLCLGAFTLNTLEKKGRAELRGLESRFAGGFSGRCGEDKIAAS